MPPSRLFVRALLVAAVAVPALRAEDSEFLGFQVGLGRPVGALADWSSGKPVFNLGVHQAIDEGEGTMLRTHIDLLTGIKGQATLDLPVAGAPVQATLENHFTEVAIGIDALYFFNGDIGHGAYLLGGVGGISTRLSSACVGNAAGGDSNWPVSGTLNTTSNKFFWSAGVGWQQSHRVGFELRYLNSRFSYQQIYFQNATVTAAVTFRFGLD